LGRKNLEVDEEKLRLSTFLFKFQSKQKERKKKRKREIKSLIDAPLRKIAKVVEYACNEIGVGSAI
jgi:ribonuclease PH